MGHEATETKEECALKELMIRLGVFADSLQEMLLLGRSVEYANIGYYTRPNEVKYKKQQIENEIFFIRATFFFKRKQLNPLIDENRIYIQRLIEQEHNEVRILKARLL